MIQESNKIVDRYHSILDFNYIKLLWNELANVMYAESNYGQRNLISFWKLAHKQQFNDFNFNS